MYPIVLPGSDSANRHVRCYCNLPTCIATGYICKSHSGCYSELTQDLKRAKHGCIDEDPNVDLSSKCMNSPVKGPGPWGASLLLCCTTDMCNHVDNPLARVRINDSLAGAAATTNLIGFTNAGNTGLTSNTGSTGNIDTTAENWFRAATIFVPVCGALILFVLIAFAIKLLKSDAMDASNKLSAAYIHHVPHQQNLEQPLMKKSPIVRTSADSFPPVHAPLLLTHTNSSERYIVGVARNEKNSLPNREDKTYIIMQHCPQQQFVSSQSVKPTNAETNRDVNVNIQHPNNDSANCSNVKLYEKQLLPSEDKLYDKETIMNWGQASNRISR